MILISIFIFSISFIRLNYINFSDWVNFFAGIVVDCFENNLFLFYQTFAKAFKLLKYYRAIDNKEF